MLKGHDKCNPSWVGFYPIMVFTQSVRIGIRDLRNIKKDYQKENFKLWIEGT